MAIRRHGVLTYYFFDMMTGDLLAELPMTGVTWGNRFNGPGSLSGSLDLADPGVQRAGPITATRTGRTVCVVDLDGDPIWGGLIWTRTYSKASRILQLGGNESWSYWEHRIQRTDYTNGGPIGGPFWTTNATTPAPAELMAAQFLSDAQAVAASGFGTDNMVITTPEEFPNTDPLPGSFPISQLQTIDQMVSNLADGGYETGFDYTMMVSWSAGPGSRPVFQAVLAYPRLGRPGASSGITIISDGDNGVDYTWPEDSTSQAWANWGTGGPGGILQYEATDDAPMIDGWPLLEATTSYSNVNTQAAIVAAANSDLAVGEWPVITPQFTVPLLGRPSIKDIVLGDDARVIITPDERFPDGVDGYLRITAIDAAPADSGLSKMVITLNLPPGVAPRPPPPGLS